MAGFGIREGKRQAKENLEVHEEGDCPRCGGEAQPSSMDSYLSCSRCHYEWKDPSAGSKRKINRPTHRQDQEYIQQFNEEIETRQRELKNLENKTSKNNPLVGK